MYILYDKDKLWCQNIFNVSLCNYDLSSSFQKRKEKSQISVRNVCFCVIKNRKKRCEKSIVSPNSPLAVQINYLCKSISRCKKRERSPKQINVVCVCVFPKLCVWKRTNGVSLVAVMNPFAVHSECSESKPVHRKQNGFLLFYRRSASIHPHSTTFLVYGGTGQSKVAHMSLPEPYFPTLRSGIPRHSQAQMRCKIPPEYSGSAPRSPHQLDMSRIPHRGGVQDSW